MALARRTFLISALAATLSAGCGWRLRGRVTLPFDTMYVNIAKNSRMGADIRRMLAGGTNVTLTETAQEAQCVLELVGSNRSREILALNAKGDAREYELTLELTFRLMSPDGDEYMVPTTFSGARPMSYNEDDYLSRGTEEGLLYNEIQHDLIVQLLNRLSALKPEIHAY